MSERKLKRDIAAKGDPSFVSFYSYFIESVHYQYFRPQEAFATGRMPLTLFENMRPAYSTKRALEMMVTFPSIYKDIGEETNSTSERSFSDMRRVKSYTYDPVADPGGGLRGLKTPPSARPVMK